MLQKNSALDLLVALLKIPSVNGIENEENIARYIDAYLKEEGIHSELQEVSEGRYNVIATVEGKNTGSHMVWNGHMDTVPFGNLEEWHTSPIEPLVEKDVVVARGSCDMKSGLAAMIHVLCEMHKADIKPEQTIKFIATCDEENGGMGAEEVMRFDHLGQPSAIFISEPTDCHLGISQKGCLWLAVEVEGITSHGAYPEAGANAVTIGNQLVDKLIREVEAPHKLLGKSTVTITKMKAGIANNMVPDQCQMTLDIRLTPTYSKEDILKTIDGFSKHLSTLYNKPIHIKYKIINERMPIDNALSWKGYENLLAIQERLYLPLDPVGVRFFTDASIFLKKAQSIPVVLMGPGNPKMAHQPNETLSLKAFYNAIDFYEAIYQEVF